MNLAREYALQQHAHNRRKIMSQASNSIRKIPLFGFDPWDEYLSKLTGMRKISHPIESGRIANLQD